MHRIPGLTYVADFVSEAEERALLADVDARPWLSDLRRRVQHYGYKYDYKARSIDKSMFVGEVPTALIGPGQALFDKKLVPHLPDQLIVNEYEPGQGIVPHVDCVPCFEDGIATVSLGSSCIMDLSHQTSKETFGMTLARRSALVFTGEARFHWQHGIRARKTDDGSPRGRRVSLTYRKVRLQ